MSLFDKILPLSALTSITNFSYNLTHGSPLPPTGIVLLVHNAIVCFGIAIVLAQVALGLLYRRRPRSLTQLVVAALEHRPQGEFSECQNDEDRLAKTRFVVNDRDDVAGGLSFKHVL